MDMLYKNHVTSGVKQFLTGAQKVEENEALNYREISICTEPWWIEGYKGKTGWIGICQQTHKKVCHQRRRNTLVDSQQFTIFLSYLFYWHWLKPWLVLLTFFPLIHVLSFKSQCSIGKTFKYNPTLLALSMCFSSLQFLIPGHIVFNKSSVTFKLISLVSYLMFQ